MGLVASKSSLHTRESCLCECCGKLLHCLVYRKWDMPVSAQLRLLPHQHQLQLRCSVAAPKPDVEESKPVLRRTVVSLMSTLFVAAATSSVDAKPMMPMMVEPDLPR